MRRYVGKGLPPHPRIAVISSDALGNFVVITPLLQLLRKELQPSAIDYFGGKRIQELQDASSLFEWSFPIRGSSPEEQESVARERKGYDLVLNVEGAAEAKRFARRLTTEQSLVCGPCEGLPFADDERGHLWDDEDWVREDLTERYRFLSGPFIGDMFCRLAYLTGALPAYEVPCESPERPIPPVLISTAATLPEKLWARDSWIEMLRFFAARKLPVGLLGAHPAQQKLFWKGSELEEELVATGLLQDLRGAFTLPQVVGALRSASMILTLDNGILHLAVAARKPTVGLFRLGIHRLWAPPFERLTVLTHAPGEAVSDIPADWVIHAVNDAI